jgi:hypothetical protein
VSRLDDMLRRRAAENAAELLEAEETATAAGKEQFDLATLEVLLEAKPGSYTEHEQSLRSSYYLLQGKLMTLADFAAHVREMQNWGFWDE